MGRAGIRKAYRTGQGNLVIRSKCEIEEHGTGGNLRSRIVVTEIPYQVNKAQLIETIANMVRDKRLEGISDIREESGRDGMRIVIECKKDANAQVVLNSLYKHTNLQISDGIILLALVENGTEPKVLNLRDILTHYLAHQKEVITRRTRFELQKTEERAHIIEGLVLALANIDEVIRIIKTSKDKNEATLKLTSAFVLSERQANAILEMRLQRLTSLEVEKLKDELEALHATIADLKDILAHESRVYEIIKNDLLTIKAKYPSERKTEISIDYGEIDDEDLIDEEDVVISMTHGGYIKRYPVAEYHAQNRGGVGITAHRPKEDDFVEAMFVCSTHQSILLFSNFGKVYSIKGYEIPEANRTARGRAMVNIVQLNAGEKIATILPVDDTKKGYLIMATKNGLVKKTRMREYVRIMRSGKIAIKINEGDELISVQYATHGEEIIIASRSGKCIRFKEGDVRPMGRDTAGVRGIHLTGKDEVVDMLVLKDGFDILTVSEKGYGKRSSPDDYRLQSRAGKGIKAGVFNEKTGKLVNMKLVNDELDIMLVTSTGIIIRMHGESISQIGRNTRGVRLMKVRGGKVATVAVTEKDEEAEVTAPEETAADLSPEELAQAAEPEETEATETVETQSEESEEQSPEEE